MLRHELSGEPLDQKGNYGLIYNESRRAAFLAGRSFRTFKELNIAASAVYTIQVVVPINVILLGLEAAIDLGFLKIETLAGGTAAGTFSEVYPKIAANNMTTKPAYTAQVTIAAGGSVSGSTLIDVLRLKADNTTGRATSVGGATQDERGVGPATYYFRLTNLSPTDAVLGTFKVRWEEHP